MDRVNAFLKACGAFFVLTVNGDFPAGRPFGAAMEEDGFLFISTGSEKAVCQQLKAHPQMQILALKPGTREWMRLHGIAEECHDVSVKERMLRECPVLKKHYASADAPHFAVFRIEKVDVEFY